MCSPRLNNHPSLTIVASELPYPDDADVDNDWETEFPGYNDTSFIPERYNPTDGNTLTNDQKKLPISILLEVYKYIYVIKSNIIT